MISPFVSPNFNERIASDLSALANPHYNPDVAATNLKKLDEPPDQRPAPKEKVEEIVEIDRSPDSRFIKYKKEVSNS